MRNIVIALFLILAVPVTLSAQKNDNPDNIQTSQQEEIEQPTQVDATRKQQSNQKERGSAMDRLMFGGNLGFSFSNTGFYLELAPMVSYRATSRWIPGAGIVYIYSEYEPIAGNKFTRNIYGFRLNSYYKVYGPISAYGEFENLNLEFFNPSDQSVRREWVPGLFLGGGIFQPVGRKGGVGIMAMYNFLYDNIRSPYSSEWVFRIGLFF